MFPPVHPFSQEIIALSSGHLELRRFLDSRDATLQQPSSRHIIQTFAYRLYYDVENRESAITTASLIIAMVVEFKMSLPNRHKTYHTHDRRLRSHNRCQLNLLLITLPCDLWIWKVSLMAIWVRVGEQIRWLESADCQRL